MMVDERKADAKAFLYPSNKFKFDSSKPDLISCISITELRKIFVRGFVKFVPAVAYHFCLNLPATFSQPRTKTFSQLCRLFVTFVEIRKLTITIPA